MRGPQLTQSPDALIARADEQRRRAVEEISSGWLSRVRDVFGGSARPLVISSSMSAEVAANVEEDLEVMSRLLEKAVARGNGDGPDQRYMGIAIPGISGNRVERNLYLDGYGALFILNVHFPLVADAGTPSKKEGDQSNSAWEQTKRELKSGPQPPMEHRGIKYNEEKVQSLKKELIAALKNATNIRGMKSEDAITIAVVGDDGGNAFGLKTLPSRTFRSSPVSPNDLPDQNGGGGGGNSYNNNNNNNGGRSGTQTRSAHQSRPAMLTLRVKKSDVDGFAKSEIGIDDFQKKVTVTTY